jgi:putative toxin-antitoxin system antitoxin component (TIGR02293 family)
MRPRLVPGRLHDVGKWHIIHSHMASTALRQRFSRARGRSPVLADHGADRFTRLVASGEAGPNSYVLLLGLETFETTHLVEVLDAGLPYGAFDRLVESSGLPADAVQALIDIPSRTMARRKQEDRFRSDESDRLVRAARVVGQALALFEGDRAAAARWLSTPQRGLGGAIPVQFARMDVGALEVERLLQRLDQGIVA